MLQDFYIDNLIETIETDEIYSIMNKRLLYFQGNIPKEDLFGPADLCYLVKESVTKGFFGLKSKKSNKVGT